MREEDADIGLPAVQFSSVLSSEQTCTAHPKPADLNLFIVQAFEELAWCSEYHQRLIAAEDELAHVTCPKKRFVHDNGSSLKDQVAIISVIRYYLNELQCFIFRFHNCFFALFRL